MNGRTWEAEEVKILRAMWLRGIYARTIGERLGRTACSVVSKAKQIGLPHRAAGTSRSKALRYQRIQRTIELFRRDWTDQQIADDLGVNVTTVLSYRSDAKLFRDQRVEMRRARGLDARTSRCCLMCRHDFLSEGIHNQVCPQCKGTRLWRSGGDYSSDARA